MPYWYDNIRDARIHLKGLYLQRTGYADQIRYINAEIPDVEKRIEQLTKEEKEKQDALERNYVI